MAIQSGLTNGPARVVLEGVPRVSYDSSFCTFPASLKACLEFMGENYTYEYIMGTSGAAFRLLWKPGWWLDNVGILVMAEDTLEPIQRAFEAVGYAHDVIFKKDRVCETRLEVERCDDEAYFRSRIVESIRDKGHPVIAFGVVGPAECGIITGYDEYGDVLIGWSYFQGSADAHEPGVEFEPSGYYRKRDWFKDTPGLIIIGDKQEKPPLDEIYRKALKWTLKVVRTPTVHGRHNGFAAYDAWVDALLHDEDFPPSDEGILSLRLNVHNDALMMLDERWCAARFLEQMAKDEPNMADELLAAAACCKTENEIMGRIDVLGSKLAEPSIRRQFASLIRQARDKNEEAANHIEQALAKGGMTMSVNQQYGEGANVGYKTRYQELPAFDLIGFTKIVESGGELYDEVRSDGRWEVLKTIAGDDKTIFGVASLDKQCPKGSYRYTVGVKAKAEFLEKLRLDDDLFTIRIKQAGWLIFTLESFKKQYGQFWNDNPYRLVQMLGWSFDRAVGLHIDAYAASYASDHDGMEFMMPVTRSTKE